MLIVLANRSQGAIVLFSQSPCLFVLFTLVTRPGPCRESSVSSLLCVEHNETEACEDLGMHLSMSQGLKQ